MTPIEFLRMRSGGMQIPPSSIHPYESKHFLLQIKDPYAFGEKVICVPRVDCLHEWGLRNFQLMDPIIIFKWGHWSHSSVWLPSRINLLTTLDSVGKIEPHFRRKLSRLISNWKSEIGRFKPSRNIFGNWKGSKDFKWGKDRGFIGLIKNPK